MSKRIMLRPEEAEKNMQEVRDKQGFIGKMETDYVSRMIKDAKRNSMIGDKLQLVIDPMYVHIPWWQREIRLADSLAIGTAYNKYKWDIPKVLFDNGKLSVIDGQHRIYGVFKAGMDAVVVEIMECSLEEAIDLFINQSKDRSNMKPKDIYRAAIAAKKPDYMKLKEICEKHNVAVVGDKKNKNTVGVLTSISDGIEMIHMNPALFDSILKLLGELGWNGYADSYNGKAYTSKILRDLKKLYAYCEGRTEEMEAALLNRCTGTEFFVDNIMTKTQAQIFDFLRDIVQYEMENPFKEKKTTKRRKVM